MVAPRHRGHDWCGLGFAPSARDRSFLYVVIEGRFEVMAPLCARIDGILKTSISANVSRIATCIPLKTDLGIMGGPTLLQWDGITGMHA